MLLGNQLFWMDLIWKHCNYPLLYTAILLLAMIAACGFAKVHFLPSYYF